MNLRTMEGLREIRKAWRAATAGPLERDEFPLDDSRAAARAPDTHPKRNPWTRPDGTQSRGGGYGRPALRVVVNGMEAEPPSDLEADYAWLCAAWDAAAVLAQACETLAGQLEEKERAIWGQVGGAPASGIHTAEQFLADAILDAAELRGMREPCPACDGAGEVARGYGFLGDDDGCAPCDACGGTGDADFIPPDEESSPFPLLRDL